MGASNTFGYEGQVSPAVADLREAENYSPPRVTVAMAKPSAAPL
jgi:hypothetical protein